MIGCHRSLHTFSIIFEKYPAVQGAESFTFPYRHSFLHVSLRSVHQSAVINDWLFSFRSNNNGKEEQEPKQDE
jgi:hypothetical protein